MTRDLLVPKAVLAMRVSPASTKTQLEVSCVAHVLLIHRVLKRALPRATANATSVSQRLGMIGVYRVSRICGKILLALLPVIDARLTPYLRKRVLLLPLACAALDILVPMVGHAKPVPLELSKQILVLQHAPCVHLTQHLQLLAKLQAHASARSDLQVKTLESQVLTMKLTQIDNIADF